MTLKPTPGDVLSTEATYYAGLEKEKHGDPFLANHDTETHFRTRS